MGRTHKKGGLTIQFHILAENGSPAWREWMEHGDMRGMATTAPGIPESVTATEIKREHGEIISMLIDKRKLEYPSYRDAVRAGKLYDQGYKHNQIARELGLTPTRVSRLLIQWAPNCLPGTALKAIGRSVWISGDHGATSGTSWSWPRPITYAGPALKAIRPEPQEMSVTIEPIDNHIKSKKPL